MFGYEKGVIIMDNENKPQNFEEPAEKKREEIYGTIREKLAIGKKNKNLRHLTNKLFKEAKYDLRKDALNKGKAGYKESTEGLDRFVQYCGDKLGIKNFSATFEKYKKHKTLKENGIAQELENFVDNPEVLDQTKYDACESLANNYNDLKKDLKNTRVLGVGKTALGKTKTLASNCLTSVIRLGRVGGTAVIGAGAEILLFGFNFKRTAADTAAVATSDKLGGIRDALKNNTNDLESLTRTTNTTPLKSQKTWKKKK